MKECDNQDGKINVNRLKKIRIMRKNVNKLCFEEI